MIKNINCVSIIGRKSDSLQSPHKWGRRHFHTKKSITLLYNVFNCTFTNFWHIKRTEKTIKDKETKRCKRNPHVRNTKYQHRREQTKPAGFPEMLLYVTEVCLLKIPNDETFLPCCGWLDMAWIGSSCVGCLPLPC